MAIDRINNPGTPDTRSNGSITHQPKNGCHSKDNANSADDSRANPSRCEALHSRCVTLCRPCLASQHPLPPDGAGHVQKLTYAFMCPPHGIVARWITMFVTIALIWAVLWSLTSEQALPGGNFFALTILFICCIIGGIVVERIHLPPLLGRSKFTFRFGDIIEVKKRLTFHKKSS